MNEYFRSGGVERRAGIERRRSKDRRDEIRFELNKPNRRVNPLGRRSSDQLGWRQSNV